MGSSSKCGGAILEAAEGVGGGEAAVDDQSVAVDVAALVGGEEEAARAISSGSPPRWRG
jgi:hypothetical protein